MKKETRNKSFYPSPMSFVHNDRNYYDVRFLQFYPKNIHAHSRTASYLLAKAFEHLNLDKSYINRILEIQKIQGINTSLWGLRFEKNKFSLEFYFYFPKKFRQNSFENLKKILNPYLKVPITKEKIKKDYYLISYNLDSSHIDVLNIYYTVLNPSKPVITIADTRFYFNSEKPVFHSYYFQPGRAGLKKVNTYYGFFGIHQQYAILEEIYACCRKLFPKEDPALSNKYLLFPYLYENGKLAHPFSVTLKPKAIGIYFAGLSVEQFIGFLRYHKYPDAYIRSVEKEKKNLDHIEYDIVVDFYLKNGKFLIKKTAFFGSF
jgi:hypothetical protein